jgi:hypothetical protein
MQVTQQPLAFAQRNGQLPAAIAIDQNRDLVGDRSQANDLILRVRTFLIASQAHTAKDGVFRRGVDRERDQGYIIEPDLLLEWTFDGSSTECGRLSSLLAIDEYWQQCGCQPSGTKLRLHDFCNSSFGHQKTSHGKEEMI